MGFSIGENESERMEWKKAKAIVDEYKVFGDYNAETVSFEVDGHAEPVTGTVFKPQLEKQGLKPEEIMGTENLEVLVGKITRMGIANDEFKYIKTVKIGEKTANLMDPVSAAF